MIKTRLTSRTRCCGTRGFKRAEEVKYRVIAANLAPEQHDRAKIIMENAGAVVVVEEYTEPSPAPARDEFSEPTLTLTQLDEALVLWPAPNFEVQYPARRFSCRRFDAAIASDAA